MQPDSLGTKLSAPVVSFVVPLSSGDDAGSETVAAEGCLAKWAGLGAGDRKT